MYMTEVIILPIKHGSQLTSVGLLIDVKSIKGKKEKIDCKKHLTAQLIEASHMILPKILLVYKTYNPTLNIESIEQ